MIAVLIIGLLIVLTTVWAVVRVGDLLVIKRLEARRQAHLAVESMGVQVLKPGVGWVHSRS